MALCSLIWNKYYAGFRNINWELQLLQPIVIENKFSQLKIRIPSHCILPYASICYRNSLLPSIVN